MAHPWPSSLAAQSRTGRNTAQLIGTVIARSCIGAFNPSYRGLLHALAWPMLAAKSKNNCFIEPRRIDVKCLFHT